MTHSLPAIPEKNNIGLLRLSFAAIVVCAHAFALSLSPALAVFQGHANAELAVQGFFVLSGFLIVMSYEKSRSLKDYAIKRVRRIYPAYLSVILFCALAGYLLLMNYIPASAYFSAGWIKYILANLTFLNFLAPDLPGIFAENPISAVNGALWTIKVEVCFYAIVPLLVWLLRTRFRLAWMGAIYLSAQIFAWACIHFAATTGHASLPELGRQLPGQMAYFITGAALYYYHGWVMRHRWSLVIFAVSVLVAMKLTGNDLLYPAALGILVMTLAFAPYLGNSERFGDVSYGLYIWHFPVLQTLVALGFFAANPWAAFAAAVVVALTLALLSWHGIEKRFLRKSSHYVAVT